MTTTPIARRRARAFVVAPRSGGGRGGRRALGARRYVARGRVAVRDCRRRHDRRLRALPRATDDGAIARTRPRECDALLVDGRHGRARGRVPPRHPRRVCAGAGGGHGRGRGLGLGLRLGRRRRGRRGRGGKRTRAASAAARARDELGAVRDPEVGREAQVTELAIAAAVGGGELREQAQARWRDRQLELVSDPRLELHDRERRELALLRT